MDAIHSSMVFVPEGHFKFVTHGRYHIPMTSRTDCCGKEKEGWILGSEHSTLSAVAAEKRECNLRGAPLKARTN